MICPIAVIIVSYQLYGILKYVRICLRELDTLAIRHIKMVSHTL
jgi:hypothetical protein